MLGENEYELEYLPIFDEELAAAVRYIARKLRSPVAANKLIDDTERAIHDRLFAPESFEPAISGSFPCEDSPFDPKRNKVYIKVTPPESWQKALAKVTPVVVGGPESALMVAEVITGSLGAKGYNVIVSGQSFVVTGDGFLEDGILSVSLKDAKGVSRAVTVEARKKTALVCTLSGAAAKGKATLEVVLAGEEPDTYRFTASRKVTVR